VIKDIAGRPIAADAYPENTNDKKTIVEQIAKLRQSFGLSREVLVVAWKWCGAPRNR
jgi:transposase